MNATRLHSFLQQQKWRHSGQVKLDLLKLRNTPDQQAGQIRDKVMFSGDNNLLFLLHGTERPAHVRDLCHGHV